jgi:hypothetical protein
MVILVEPSSGADITAKIPLLQKKIDRLSLKLRSCTNNKKLKKSDS